MRRVTPASVSLALVTVLVLSACSSSSTSAPPTPSPSNISGDYLGTMTDSAAGTGTASATLAQTGASAGGTLTFAPTSGTLTAHLSMTIAGSNATSGAMVIDYPNNGPTCTFSMTGTYDTSTNVLNGSYSAVTNCSGQSGTFSLTQQCTDTITGHARREKVGGIVTC
jgi:plastocyanin